MSTTTTTAAANPVSTANPTPPTATVAAATAIPPPAPPSSPSKIGLILCSTRQPRVCPQIGDFVLSTIAHQLPADGTYTLSTIDLLEHPLPFFDEPIIPAQLLPPYHPHYTQPHSREWSQTILSYSAFIFVCPQYNWGYPAVLKNAIDYLFHEWKGKPAMIVSYGGHGGGKAAGQLKQVLQGVRTRVVDTMPGLAFVGKEAMERAMKGKRLDGLDGDGNGEGQVWKEEREEVKKAFGELLQLLEEEEGQKK